MTDRKFYSTKYLLRKLNNHLPGLNAVRRVKEGVCDDKTEKDFEKGYLLITRSFLSIISFVLSFDSKNRK